jgi:hypothetical protein
VAADAQKRAWPVLAPHDERRHLAGPGGEAVAHALDAASMAHVLRCSTEDAILLAPKNVRIGVLAPGQSASGALTPRIYRAASSCLWASTASTACSSTLSIASASVR